MNKQKQYKNSLNEQISGLVMPIFVSMRPKQWSKNLLIFFALLFSVEESWYITNWSTVDSMLANSIIAFIIFSAISGSIYLINDVINIRKNSAMTKEQLEILLNDFNRLCIFAGHHIDDRCLRDLHIYCNKFTE